jgi:hypothetical protein
MTRRILTETTWPYRTIEADQTWERVARRYGLTYEEVQRLNRSVMERTRGREHRIVGSPVVIRLPVPQEAYAFDWEQVAVPAGTTLGQVATNRNRAIPERLIRRLRPLTPEYLWSHVLNSEFRNQYVVENPGRRQYQRTIENIRLASAGHLWIPWPMREMGRPIHVAPNGNSTSQEAQGPTGNVSTCSTCRPLPDWVVELHSQYLDPMGDTVMRLRSSNSRYREAIQNYMRQVGRLHVVELLLRVMGEEPRTQAVGGLVRSLESLQRAFTRTLGEWPGATGEDAAMVTEDVIFSDGADDRRRFADRLLDKIEEPRFSALIQQAFDLDDVVVNESYTIRERLCGLMADVFAQVSMVGGVGARAARLMDRALQCADGPPERSRTQAIVGQDALQTLLSLGGSNLGLPEHRAANALGGAAAVGAVGSSLVGNLPGPPSLAVAILQLRLTREVLKISSVVQGRGAGDLATVADTRIQQLARFGGFEPADLRNRLGQVRSPAGAQDLAGELSGRYQSGQGWCSALAVINLIGFINTALNPPAEPFNYRVDSPWTVWAAQLAGSGASSVSSLIGMFARFGAGGAWEPFALGLGEFCAITIIFAGAVNFIIAFQRGNTEDGVVAFAQIVGGVLVLCSGPWAVAGAAILVGVAVVEVARGRRIPGSKRVVLGLLEACKTDPTIARVLDRNGELSRQFDDLVSAVNDSLVFRSYPPRDAEAMRIEARLEGLGVPRDIVRPFVSPDLLAEIVAGEDM